MSPGFAAKHWYRVSALSLVLFPVSIVFDLLVRLRRAMYGLRILRSVKLPVPVIVVGNLTVGGTGKTPLVLWVAEQLQLKGRRPAILCRGYGGTEGGPQEVARDDDPARFGDEAVLLALRSGCPVWIGRDRAAAGAQLLERHPECDTLICDDGLQHYGLARDLEIAVEDERGHGNGMLLPAGPLREPARRPVDAVVINRGQESGTNQGRTESRGRATKEFAMHLQPQGFFAVDDPLRAVALSELSGKRLHAVAGIGNPQRFFALLRHLGLDPVCHAYPDHHAYAPGDLAFPECDLVLMTEKDAVKCTHSGRRDLVALRVDAQLDPAFPDFLMQGLHGRASA